MNVSSAAELEKQLEEAYKLRQLSEEKIIEIEHALTKLLCPKGKAECDPAYCTFQITDSCEFLKKWRSLVTKYNLSS